MDPRLKNNSKNNNTQNIRAHLSRQLGSKTKVNGQGSKSKQKANKVRPSKNQTNNNLAEHISPPHSLNSNGNIYQKQQQSTYLGVFVSTLKIMMSKDMLLAKKEPKFGKQINIMQQLLDNVEKDAKLRNIQRLYPGNKDKQEMLAFLVKEREKILSMLKLECAKSKLQALDSQDWREEIIRLYTYVTYQNKETAAKNQEEGRDLLSYIYQRFDELSNVVNWLFATIQKMGNMISKENSHNSDDKNNLRHYEQLQNKIIKAKNRSFASLSMQELSSLIYSRLEEYEKGKSSKQYNPQNLELQKVQTEMQKLKTQNIKLIKQLQKIEEEFEYIVEDKLHLQNKLACETKKVIQLKKTITNMTNNSQIKNIAKISTLRQQITYLKLSIHQLSEGIHRQLSRQLANMKKNHQTIIDNQILCQEIGNEQLALKQLLEMKQLEINKYLKIISSLKQEITMLKMKENVEAAKYKQNNRYADIGDSQTSTKSITISHLNQNQQPASEEDDKGSEQLNFSHNFEPFQSAQLYKLESNSQEIVLKNQETQTYSENSEVYVQTETQSNEKIQIGVQSQLIQISNIQTQTIQKEYEVQAIQVSVETSSIQIQTIVRQYSFAETQTEQINKQIQQAKQKEQSQQKQNQELLKNIIFYQQKLKSNQSIISNFQESLKNKQKIIQNKNRVINRIFVYLHSQLTILNDYLRVHIKQYVENQIKDINKQIIISFQMIQSQLFNNNEKIKVLQNQIQQQKIQFQINNNKQMTDIGVNTLAESQTDINHTIDYFTQTQNMQNQIKPQLQQGIKEDKIVGKHIQRDCHKGGLLSLFRSQECEQNTLQSDIAALKSQLSYQISLNQKLQAHAISQLIQAGYLIKQRPKEGSFIQVQEILMFVSPQKSIEQQEQETEQWIDKNESIKEACNKEESGYWSPNRAFSTKAQTLQRYNCALTDPKNRYPHKLATNKENQIQNDIEIEKIFDF